MTNIEDELKSLRQFRDEVVSGKLKIWRGEKDVTKDLGDALIKELASIEAILRDFAGQKNT